mmetsp:Transcript_95964/g.200479  ORF Transcript_95964/g.200479 Transcript_95964/m.200479 type:complete len:84 (+) Transcript_95964:75-326(+)
MQHGPGSLNPHAWPGRKMGNGGRRQCSLMGWHLQSSTILRRQQQKKTTVANDRPSANTTTTNYKANDKDGGGGAGVHSLFDTL